MSLTPQNLESVWLVIEGIPRNLWQFKIARDEKTIGRGKHCAIRVGDRSVSREHAVVWIEEGRVIIRDLESANGTHVNGCPVDVSDLEINDKVDIGHVRLLVVGKSDSWIEHTAQSQTGATTITNKYSPGVRAAFQLPEHAHNTSFTPEDRAALYSLGETLHMSESRSSLLRHILEWLREWLDVDQAAVALSIQGKVEIEDRVRSKRLPRGSGVQADAVLEAIKLGSIALRSEAGAVTKSEKRSVQVFAIAVPGIKPRGAIYGEWVGKHQFGSRQQLLLEGAVTVLSQHLKRAGVSSLDTFSETSDSNSDSNIATTPGDLLIGGSALDGVREFIRRAASVDATVLITGETGTGKELVAQSIHLNSRRAGNAFVVKNCGAFPEALLESELFGHVPGSFTGATKLREGVFDLANEGTLFLDELGEMPPSLQAKLLRVLEEQNFQRVGGNQTIKVNVRIIAATNRDPAIEVQEGNFRQDLYYRLQVITIHLPPLRDRPEDVPDLSLHLMKQVCDRMERQPLSISKPAMELLIEHPWPGNIRELRNTIERAVIFAKGNEVKAEDIVLPEIPSSTVAQHKSMRASLQELELEHIQEVIDSVSGNKAKAAKILGIDRTTLYRKLNRGKKMGFDPE